MAAVRRTRILIVDDSAVMRSLLRSVVSARAGLEVAGTAADGVSALGMVDALRPDLVLLDVEMPVMDGLATLRHLRARGNTIPVIVCSALTRRGARVTIEALACGASDYVAKPAGQPDREAAMQALSQELIPRIEALTAHSGVVAAAALAPVQPAPVMPLLIPPGAVLLKPPAPALAPAVVAIGVSTGGPVALDVLLPALPAGFPLPVLVVQHMPEPFTGVFAERLNGRCRLPVREAAEGDPLRAGTVYIARGNWHMEVLPAACAGLPPTLHLTQAPAENHCRPAADVLFRSAASVYGSGVLAVVLTGMGCDGVAGCRVVRGHGGSVLVQDQASSAVWGMPGAVVHAGLANRVLPLGAIAAEILRVVSPLGSECKSGAEARALQEPGA
jgi:two-component system chemotaxis response regulator CheB